MSEKSPCPVCNETCPLLDRLDFNKSCEEARGRILGHSGLSVSYFLCGNCGFCFAPEIAAWTLAEFKERIYNDKYLQVDPDYAGRRPRANAAGLISKFGVAAHFITHLDYGGGNGLLANLLGDSNWQSDSYDPFADGESWVNQLGKYDLITAFEVFEHVPSPQRLISRLMSLLAPRGIVLFSTLLSDGNIHPNQKLSWWYAAPRNGHISLFSRKCLEVLAQDHGFHFHSFSAGFHVFFTELPPWASGVIRIV